MTWTNDRLEQVRVMWADGFSASQIARALGAGISRSAVIGIIHRRRFGAGRPPRQTSSPSFVPKKAFIAPIEEEAPIVVTDPEPVRGVTILSVGHRQCRWPFGDPQKPDFHLCGNVTLIDSPYCLAHMRKAHQPGNIRARKDDTQEELAAIFKAERVFA